MDEQSTNPLMQRVLRFINYNSDLYIRHRDRGEYQAAVQRLERLSKLADVVDQAEREGKCQLNWLDHATVKLVRHHVDAMFGRNQNVLDFDRANAQYSSTPA